MNQVFKVTLSPALYKRLSEEASRLGLPLAYVVAGLVVDTMNEELEKVDPVLTAG